jgi:very-short-patch-repair endonuclease
MRAGATASEARLWSKLRARQQLGVRFRRQVPIAGRYIADFLAPAERLVVEIDGAYHAKRSRADERRDRRLRRLGFRVLRLPAALVERNLEEAVARIHRALAEAPP